MSPPLSTLVGLAETSFYLTILAALAWLYFQTLLKLAAWRGRPPQALALLTYAVFIGTSFCAPMFAVERGLAWTGISASGRSNPDILLWLVSFVVSFGTLFLIHRRRLEQAGYFGR